MANFWDDFAKGFSSALSGVGSVLEMIPVGPVAMIGKGMKLGGTISDQISRGVRGADYDKALGGLNLTTALGSSGSSSLGGGGLFSSGGSGGFSLGSFGSSGGGMNGLGSISGNSFNLTGALGSHFQGVMNKYGGSSSNQKILGGVGSLFQGLNKSGMGGLF
jgi:hypothetical protein